MDNINIVMVADWQYIMPLETTVKSIFYHNQNVTLHILNPDIPQEWFREINDFVKPLHSKIIDCKYSPDDLKDQTVSLEHVDSTSSARLLIPRFLDCPRAIYLDADLIVCQSLTDFYNMDMQGHPLAAVTDWGQPQDFNAGVMLLDLNYIRQIPDITKQMLEFGAQPNLPTGDQTVYNHFFGGGNFLNLANIYNLQMGQEQKVANWIPSGVPGAKKLLKKIHGYMTDLPKAVVIHYLGAAKPWNITSVCRERDLWWQYHDLDWNEVIRREPLPVRPADERAQVLVYTFTDQIWHLDELIQHFPQVTFNICSPGLFNDHWNPLIKYANVNLIPVVLDDKLAELEANCVAYLDITPVPEEYKGADIIQKLLDHGGQVYSFASTQTPSLADNEHYHVFGDDQFVELEQALFSQLTTKQD